MTREEVMAWQRNLGVPDDGMIGRGTLTAWFKNFGADSARAAELALAANVHFRTYGILDARLRLQHFTAQVAHESGGFRWMEEIWGPTSAQRGYEGRHDLGNVQKGDGFRYKGRGPIQLTGRANYRLFSREIGIDFETSPTLVAIPSIGLLVACRFWEMHGLNELADKNDIETITRRVNGGLNGFDDRKALAAKAKVLLS